MTDNLPEWCDNTFFDGVPSQIDSENESVDQLIPKFRKENENSSKVDEINGVNPRKRPCLPETKQKQDIISNSFLNSFYGLPISVKTLIKKVKGIDELYGKLSFIISIPHHLMSLGSL